MDNKVQIVKAFESEEPEIVDDWENYEPETEVTIKSDPLIDELIYKSVQIEKTINASKRHYATFEEPLNEDLPEQKQLKTTKIDYVLIAAIVIFIILFWLIFLRR